MSLPRASCNRGAASCVHIIGKNNHFAGLKQAPAPNAAAVRKDLEFRTRQEKSVIVGCLGDSVMAKTGAIIEDDDKTTCDLWGLTDTSTQGLKNLSSELDRLRYG